MRGDGGRSARRFASVDEVQTGCINIDYPDLIAFATRPPKDREKEARKCHCDLRKAIPSVHPLGVHRLNRSRLYVAA